MRSLRDRHDHIQAKPFRHAGEQHKVVYVDEALTCKSRVFYCCHYWRIVVCVVGVGGGLLVR